MNGDVSQSKVVCFLLEIFHYPFNRFFLRSDFIVYVRIALVVDREDRIYLEHVSHKSTRPAYSSAFSEVGQIFRGKQKPAASQYVFCRFNHLIEGFALHGLLGRFYYGIPHVHAVGLGVYHFYLEFSATLLDHFPCHYGGIVCAAHFIGKEYTQNFFAVSGAFLIYVDKVLYRRLRGLRNCIFRFHKLVKFDIFNFRLFDLLISESEAQRNDFYSQLVCNFFWYIACAVCNDLYVHLASPLLF